MKGAARLLISAAAVTFLCAAGSVETKIASIRIHGNHTLPDAEVISIASIAVGGSFSDNMVEQIEKRLLDSKKFASAQVRVRYRSFDESGDVALILLVEESQSVPGRFMVAPIVSFSDEYGFTAGAMLALVNLPTEGGRLSFPLSWGGIRRAGMEIQLPLGQLDEGRISNHLLFAGERRRTVNPHFDIPDNRIEAGGGFASRFRFLSFGLRADWSDVTFDQLHERFVTAGANVTLDTRVDASIPGDAAYVGFGWERLLFQSGTDRPDANRYLVDLRGYKRLIGRSLLAAQFFYNPTDAPLPPYEKPFLGGGATLRGWAPGRFIGDNIALTTLELRWPLTSPLSFARAGVHFFWDSGAVYDYGQKFSDAKFHHGVGLGGFFRVAIISARVDVGWNLEGGTRFHIASGFKF